MLTTLTNGARRWVEEHHRRALLRVLLNKNDQHLQDIGLRRADIEAELGLPQSRNARDYASRLSVRSLSFDGLR